jgi:hypothetical protein
MRTNLSAWVNLCIITAAAGCGTPQFPTKVVYESEQSFVRLETDQTVEAGNFHSHPVSVSAEQMAAVLGGVVVEEPIGRMPLYDDLSRPRRHPAFTDAEIEFFAPLLAKALRIATPEEVVTFYQTRRLSAIRREVTSGGLFVQGDRLHLFLSNYRSKTHYRADIGVSDTTDDRLTPMKPIAPQEGKLEFEPKPYQVPSVPGGLARLFYWDRRELIVLFRELPPRPLSSPASHAVDILSPQ